ncbi:MAG: iron-containing alcohol dehydrogenase [Caldisericota bacterium]|nr:iron-containing alcohol dehydrogenase [Caldisericota bacterium]
MGLSEFFQFYVPTKIIFGEGVASDFSVELEDMSVKKPLIVTDEVIEKLGLVEYVVNGLKENGVEVGGIFNEVPQDSSVGVVNKIADLYEKNSCDGFIAIEEEVH